MTVVARDGRDKPFSDWLRSQPGLESRLYSLDILDIDFSFHHFITRVDKNGTREVKLMLDLEVKTFGKNPNANQIETLYFRHQRLQGMNKLYSTCMKKKVSVWHFGQFILRMDGGDRPDKCSSINWVKFGKQGMLTLQEINEPFLIEILQFKRRPDTFKKLDLRRHHKTSIITVVDHGGLFPLWAEEVHRS